MAAYRDDWWPEEAIDAPRILLLAFLPIGDTLFAAPTLQALRMRYPTARITALVHESTAALMRCIPAVDDVVVFPVGADWENAARLAGALRRLRALHFDVCIDLTSPAYKWIALACGIRRRTYMKFDPLWWLLPGSHRRWRLAHAARHYYECAQELDLPPWESIDHAPWLQIPRGAQAEARAFLLNHGIAARQPGQPLIGLHAGGAGLGGLKRWPPDRFAALADRLSEEWSARIVLLGGPADKELAREVATLMRAPAIIAAGATSLPASIALLEACDLFAGNDSGPLHLAAAMGTSYVGIYGPTAPTSFRPLPRRHDQGLLVLPAQPPRRPVAFVGSKPIWRQIDQRAARRALYSISVGMVDDACITFLQGPSRQIEQGGKPDLPCGEPYRILAAEPMSGL